MPPLVRHQPKGYAAPPEPVPWYEAVFAYVLVMPGVLVWFVGIPVTISYWDCTGEEGGLRCRINGELLQSSTGAYGGIVAAAAICFGVSMLCAVLVQLLMRRLHFLVVWAIALLGSVSGIVGYLAIAGAHRHPLGTAAPTLTGGRGQNQ